MQINWLVSIWWETLVVYGLIIGSFQDTSFKLLWYYCEEQVLIEMYVSCLAPLFSAFFS